MPLYAYNKRFSAQTIPVVGTAVPPSQSPPIRGPAVNVTSELRPVEAGGFLTTADYGAINLKVLDGTFDFEWVGTVQYETPGLATSRPSSAPGTAVTDVTLRDPDGNELGTSTKPLRVDVAPPGDLYLATSRTIVLADGSPDLQYPIFYFRHVDSDPKEYLLRRLELFIQGAGPSIEAGAFELKWGELEDGSVPPFNELRPATPLNRGAPQSFAQIGVPSGVDLPGFKHLLFDWPVDAAFTGPLIWPPGGDFIAPIVLPAGTTTSYGLTVTILDRLLSTIRMSAALVWQER